MKILNLYAGIGENRANWGNTHDITAVEYKEDIAQVYRDRFPEDTVIIADAHEYMLNHYKEFDFIWSSPPCQTHSRTNYFTEAIRKVPLYPDMKLWQEIIYLKQFCKGLWVIENVRPYYEPFIPKYIKIGRHLIWSSFKIYPIKMPNNEIGTMMKQYARTGKHAHNKTLAQRNAVNPKLGQHILNCAIRVYEYKKNHTEISLFE